MFGKLKSILLKRVKEQFYTDPITLVVYNINNFYIVVCCCHSDNFTMNSDIKCLLQWHLEMSFIFDSSIKLHWNLSTGGYIVGCIFGVELCEG